LKITADVLAGREPRVHPVRVARALRGMTQQELERRAGLSPTSVSHIEARRRDPDPATQLRIAMALDADVDALFPESR
jgi:transcriptional regulator with XRE-family HTH domain